MIEGIDVAGVCDAGGPAQAELRPTCAAQRHSKTIRDSSAHAGYLGSTQITAPPLIGSIASIHKPLLARSNNNRKIVAN
jgi:hypothetical protein